MDARSSPTMSPMTRPGSAALFLSPRIARRASLLRIRHLRNRHAGSLQSQGGGGDLRSAGTGACAGEGIHDAGAAGPYRR
jgi:hypothetical protein